MVDFKDVISDFILLFKLIGYAIYYIFELIIRNLAPSKFAKKNVKGDNILITGAGKFNPS